MTREEVEITKSLQGKVDNVFDITTDEEALRKFLIIAHEYADPIFDWFSRQKEIYNFVGNDDVGLEALVNSKWENGIFGGTFVVLCRQFTGYDSSRRPVYEACERRFEFNAPQPERKY
jgi:hypothetical protein